jgi:hypothetical protein
MGETAVDEAADDLPSQVGPEQDQQGGHDLCGHRRAQPTFRSW